MVEWSKIIDLALLSSLPYWNTFISISDQKHPVRRNREPGRRELPRICGAGINCAFNPAPLVAKC